VKRHQEGSSDDWGAPALFFFSFSPPPGGRAARGSRVFVNPGNALARKIRSRLTWRECAREQLMQPVIPGSEARAEGERDPDQPTCPDRSFPASAPPSRLDAISRWSPKTLDPPRKTCSSAARGDARRVYGDCFAAQPELKACRHGRLTVRLWRNRNSVERRSARCSESARDSLARLFREPRRHQPMSAADELYAYLVPNYLLTCGTQ